VHEFRSSKDETVLNTASFSATAVAANWLMLIPSRGNKISTQNLDGAIPKSLVLKVTIAFA
jgi:hypothetical protein